MSEKFKEFASAIDPTFKPFEGISTKVTNTPSSFTLKPWMTALGTSLVVLLLLLYINPPIVHRNKTNSLEKPQRCLLKIIGFSSLVFVTVWFIPKIKTMLR